MKSVSKIFVAVCVVAAALFLTYKLVNKAPDTQATAEEQVIEIISTSGCLSCHSENPDLPFYAGFPIVGNVVKEDVAKGYKFYDMQPLMDALLSGNKVGEVDMARFEHTALSETMPPAKYYLVHWGASLTDKEKEMVSNWVSEHRKAHYPNTLAAEAFKNETVRPVEDAVEVNAEKVALGDLLFHDTRLSIDNTVSCATCHSLATGGVDNKQFSEGVFGQFGGVNAPTVFNAHYNFVQFWDGRAKTLADQAAGPPLNPVEMGYESFDDICAKLNKDASLRKQFAAIYPDGITEKNITDAIQEFERTLLTPNSRFDKYLKGDASAIDETEVAGYELFKKYSCATCHAGENLGGLSYELMGTYKDYFSDRGTELTIEDNGRFKETKVERDRHRFKVPGLRNIALTGPYFHDGTKQTLGEAVADMAEYESGVTLGKEETDKIVAFLNTLTGEFRGKTLVNENLN